MPAYVFLWRLRSPNNCQHAVPGVAGLRRQRYECAQSRQGLTSGWVKVFVCDWAGLLVCSAERGSGRLRAGEEFVLPTAVQAVACENVRQVEHGTQTKTSKAFSIQCRPGLRGAFKMY